MRSSPAFGARTGASRAETFGHVRPVWSFILLAAGVSFVCSRVPASNCIPALRGVLLEWKHPKMCIGLIVDDFRNEHPADVLVFFSMFLSFPSNGCAERLQNSRKR